MDLQQQRKARNETAFRQINEEIEALVDSLADVTHESPRVWEFVCECSSLTCAAALRMTRSEYEMTREHPRRFVIAPGHVEPSIEQVVDRSTRYWVVEKFGESGEIAEESDPRA